MCFQHIKFVICNIALMKVCKRDLGGCCWVHWMVGWLVGCF